VISNALFVLTTHGFGDGVGVGVGVADAASTFEAAVLGSAALELAQVTFVDASTRARINVTRPAALLIKARGRTS
jgi:hypothetical protein